MSSATPKYPDAFRVGVQQQDRIVERILRMGLSARQQELNRVWAYYCAEQYAACKIGWNGMEVHDHLEKETISRSGVVPPGFFNAAAFDELPLEYRRPRAPMHVVRSVVNKFSSLLFSQRTKPKIEISQDPEAQAFVEALVKTSRLWVRFAQARKFGGGQGSACLTFRFRDGLPIIEVHDPRWCSPTFLDRATGELSALEIRYMYPEEIRDEHGVPKEIWYWYRRVIDGQTDVIYQPAPVGDGDEPEWVVGESAPNLLGEFPGVWIRNTETDELDGEPDCHGMFETSDEIDALMSQASTGALENSDPTLHVADENEMESALKKGSKNSIKTTEKGSVKYVEMTGEGVKTAREIAKDLRSNFLEVVQCVLDTENETGPAQTATEISRRYEAMFDRGDSFREQYGETGIKPLLEKMLRAVIRLGQGIQVGGEIRQATFRVPGNLAAIAQRSVDSPLQIELKWPPWVKATPTDTQAASNAVATARTAKVISSQDALQYIAPFVGIEDPAAALQRLQAETQQEQDALTAQMMTATRAGMPEPGSDHQFGHGRPPNAGQPGGASPPPHAPPTPSTPPELHGEDPHSRT
jgi:hypothetical protein